VEVDCERRAVRLGIMTGYRNRDLRTDPKVLRPADSAFVNPTPSAPLGAVVRALCDRDFRRPLAGGARMAKAPVQKPVGPPLTVITPSASAATALKTAAPKPATPKPSPKTGSVSPSIQVQVGASTSLADAKGLLARFRRKFSADLAGLSGDVATAAVDGKTVYRVLVTGFRSASAAKALCGRLQAAGQACFVRR
jgi:cell division septation protein DedD